MSLPYTFLTQVHIRLNEVRFFFDHAKQILFRVSHVNPPSMVNITRGIAHDISNKIGLVYNWRDEIN